jgi:hypothetical protein
MATREDKTETEIIKMEIKIMDNVILKTMDNVILRITDKEIKMETKIVTEAEIITRTQIIMEEEEIGKTRLRDRIRITTTEE